MIHCAWISDASADENELKPNEEYINGGKACQTTCAGLKQPCCVNYFVAPTAYYCKKGFARRKLDHNCIPVDSNECQREVLPEEPTNCDANPPANS